MNPQSSASPEVLDDEVTARLYEITVLLPYPMAQKEEHQAIKEIEAIFKEADAREVSKDVWGRRGLAYPIKGHAEGNFVVYHQEIEPSKVREIAAALRIVPGVLRHIIVTPPKGYRILKYSESYEVWLKERESASEKTKREREEQIQQRIADKAKRQVKREKTAKAGSPAEAVSKEEIGKKLDKLISDDSIEI